MNRLNLLIADGSEEFCFDLSEALNDHFHVSHCCNGKQALGHLQNRKIDILVLDLMISELDGISILHTAASLGIKPVVLAMTRILTDYVAEESRILGIDYLMVKPCDYLAVADRVHDLSKRAEPSKPKKTDVRTYIAQQLSTLGVPANLKGYLYLQDSILLAYNRPDISLTKELYPTVGRAYNSTMQQVERSIRNAVNAAWEAKIDENWALYFSRNSEQQIPHPSNGFFISSLSTDIRLHLDEIQFDTSPASAEPPPT